MKVFRFFRKVLKWGLIFFFTSSILAVIVYRFVPVYVTPPMVIQAVGNLFEGKPMVWHHTWKPLDKISPHLAVAVISSEDAHFLTHHGFDWEAIQDAYEENQKNKEQGKARFRGGSTISQQVAKNVFLWHGRTWLRKGLEAYFTFLIELFWSKERIMEVYLNSIEMGPDVYGAEAAANTYFHKSAKLLTKEECALIATCLPQPRKRDLGHPSKHMLKLQKTYLKRMAATPAFPPKE